MLIKQLACTLLLCASGIASACGAHSQDTPPPRPYLEMDLDARTRITAGGKQRTGLYSGSLSLKDEIAPNLTLEVIGSRKEPHLLILPASGSFLIQQATIEKEWKSQRAQLGVIRIPFGIYDYKETYASGLIDYPMPRVDFSQTGVDWGVPGGMWVGGTSALQIEAALFSGKAVGPWGNLNRLGGGTVRAQTYVKDLVVGASRWDGFIDLPDFSSQYAGAYNHTQVHLTGVDMRYTRPHLLLRGEFLFGTMGGDQMRGWYLDTYYHLPKYEKFTLVSRVEEMRPTSKSPTGRQLTLGTRFTATQDWIFSLNWRINNMNKGYQGTWTPYAGRGGNFFIQAFYKLRL